jgi:hypothetical protein
LRALAVALGLGHLGGTILLTGLAFIASVYGFAGRGCYGSCGGPNWWDEVESWQWDAIGLLGAAAGIAGLVALFLVGLPRWWPAAVALGAQAALLAPVVALLVQSDQYHVPQLVLGCLATLGAGFLLVYLQNRRRTGTA